MEKKWSSIPEDREFFTEYDGLKILNNARMHVMGGEEWEFLFHHTRKYILNMNENTRISICLGLY